MVSRKYPIREARAVSQTYAVALRRLAVAQALRSPDTLELSAAEYVARTNYQRAMRELNI
jgi:hypothetical protein